MIRLFVFTMLLAISFTVACTKSIPLNEDFKFKTIAEYKDLVATTGRIRSGNQAFISVKNGGSLDTIKVKGGDMVKAGQILAVIDKQTRTANLERALSNYKLAKAEYRRISSLYRNNSTTQSELDKAESSLAVKEAELKIAREELDDAIVRAPIDGRVVYFAFTTGDTVPDGSRLAVIEDPEALEMRVKIPFDKVNKVLGTHMIAVKEYNIAKRMAEGEAFSYSAKIERLQSNSNYDSGYGELRVQFLDKPKFNPGDLVHITLYEHIYQNALAVPAESIFSLKGQNYILFNDEAGKLTKEQITVIETSGSQVIIENFAKKVQTLVGPPVGTSWQAFLKNDDVAKLF